MGGLGFMDYGGFRAYESWGCVGVSRVFWGLGIFQSKSGEKRCFDSQNPVRITRARYILCKTTLKRSRRAQPTTLNPKTPKP